jgi:hypothetical protein
MSVKVSGLNAMLAKLQKAGNPNAIGPALTEAVEAGAQVVFDAVAENTPESTDRWTDESSALKQGELREGLVQINTNGDRGTPKSVVTFSAETIHVARWVDRGHRLVEGGKSKLLASGKTRGRGQEVGYVEGRAFFREATEEKADEVKAVVRQKLKSAVDAILKN